MGPRPEGRPTRVAKVKKSESSHDAETLWQVQVELRGDENVPFAGIYAGIKFPPYKYEPYPKWVKKLDGTSVMVQNESEHLKATTEAVVLQSEVDPIVSERDDLAAQVADKDARILELETQLASKMAASKAEVPGKITSVEMKAPK